jgi:hypothetical protein
MEQWRANRDHCIVVTVFGLVSVVVVVFYHPILNGYFISDDYVFVARMLERAPFLLRGEQILEWLFAYNPVFLRPVSQWLFLLNYWFWDTNATGYYIVNIGLHALNAFLVYLLVLRVTRKHFGALAASLFFALHPIHPDSVCWIADSVDLLATFFLLLSTVYFVLFRRHHRRLYYFVTLVGFALATLTKESTLTLPAVLLAYDLLFSWRTWGWNILKAQIPLWGMLPSYVLLRILLFGQFGGYSNQGFLRFGWELFIQYYALVFSRPFLVDIDAQSFGILVAIGVFLIGIFRHSRPLWLGVAWMFALLIPAGSANYVAPRLAYIPSVGLALLQGAIIVALFKDRKPVWRGIAVCTTVFLVLVYGWSLVLRVDDWAAVGRMTRALVEKTRMLYPVFPSDARLYFTGIPEYLRGIDVYTGNLPFVFQIAYRNNPTLYAYAVDRFPLITDQIEHTYFFEYHRGNVIEHPEVRQLLLARQRCSHVKLPAIAWNFDQDTQGWEPWHQVAEFGIRERALVLQSEGTDPFLGSSEIEVPAMAFAGIEITMKAHAPQPFLQGQIYWRVAGADDFSPHIRQEFEIIADGEWHTYYLPLASGLLATNDRIIQVRFDPANAPARIGIQSIRLLSQCIHLEDGYCRCAP